MSEDSILAVFRNQVWCDAEYVPGFEVACDGPSCEVVFRTTSTVRRYHRRECHAAAAAARTAGSRHRSIGSVPTRSPERQAREEATLRAAAAAEAEWSDVIAEEPRTSVWSVASIDQPIGDGGVLQDVLAGTVSDGDPPSELERAVVREVLGGLTEEAISAMDEDELAVLQRQLLAADAGPSTSPALET